jgi:uncharacterized surface protein with fasciclin (FAS1) repeats/uncharacterized membrane protein YuzA (DUF378 family)
VKKLDLLAATLVVIGGLNWGFVALAKFDLVAWIFGLDFGQTNAASRIVYGLVGLAAVYGIGSLLASARRPRAHAVVAGAVVVVVFAVGVATATAGRATTAGPRVGEKNLVRTAVAAGQFKTLASLLQKAGLAGTLEGKGPFTVFAPTDAAFAKVPKATLASLAKNKTKLRAVLLYHVVQGKVTAMQATKLRSAKTLEGKSVSIRVSGGQVIVGGATVVKANVLASNGVIHVINKVLIP